MVPHTQITSLFRKYLLNSFYNYFFKWLCSVIGGHLSLYDLQLFEFPVWKFGKFASIFSWIDSKLSINNTWNQ